MRRLLLCLAAVISGCAPQPEPAPEERPVMTLTIFHNGTGPMCVEALDYLATMTARHGNLRVEEHLTTEPASLALLQQMRSQFAASEGVSASFGYLPVIFFGERAFSGFNAGVRQALDAAIEAASASPAG